jgi:preprotein translocase subunit SecE
MADETLTARNPLLRMRDYFLDVRAEMRRVTWPGKVEIYGTTLMVVLTTFVFGLYFWICDQAFSRAVTKMLDFFLKR